MKPSTADLCSLAMFLDGYGFDVCEINTEKSSVYLRALRENVRISMDINPYTWDISYNIRRGLLSTFISHDLLLLNLPSFQPQKKSNPLLTSYVDVKIPNNYDSSSPNIFNKYHIDGRGIEVVTNGFIWNGMKHKFFNGVDIMYEVRRDLELYAGMTLRFYRVK